MMPIRSIDTKKKERSFDKFCASFPKTLSRSDNLTFTDTGEQVQRWRLLRRQTSRGIIPLANSEFSPRRNIFVAVELFAPNKRHLEPLCNTFPPHEHAKFDQVSMDSCFARRVTGSYRSTNVQA